MRLAASVGLRGEVRTIEEQLAEEIVRARGDQQIAEDIERTAQGRGDKP